MISFKNLNGISLETISNTLNEVFSDYSIPINFPVETLEQKFVTENIQRNLSIGAFDENELVGIILHGYNPETNVIYNGGTGVIPNYRGQQLTQKMYAFAFTICKDLGIRNHQLEVISNNIPAIKSYKNVGFSIQRTLNCFKGKIVVSNVNPLLEIKEFNTIEKEFNTIDWQELQSFWEIQPSWQNAILAMKNANSSVTFLGAFLDNRLVGYVIINPKLNRIHQLSVHPEYRNNKIGSTLLHHVAQNFSENITCINVDDASFATTAFFEKIGLTNFLQQYEMKM